VIGLVQVGEQARADRYTYLPLIGIFIALAWSIPAHLAASLWRRRAVGATAAVVLMAASVYSWHQLSYWRSDATLWPHVLEVTGKNPVALLNWGNCLYKNGLLDEAEQQFTRALQVAPHYELALNNLGSCYLRQGRVERALPLFQRVNALNPREPRAYTNLGLALAQQGKWRQACAPFEQAIRLEPERGWYHFLLATALAELGDGAAAERCRAEGFRLDPTWPSKARRLAKELGRTDQKYPCPAQAAFFAKQAVLEPRETQVGQRD
jgi:tetratricopeptide (TPR) repeat protein